MMGKLSTVQLKIIAGQKFHLTFSYMYMYLCIAEILLFAYVV